MTQDQLDMEFGYDLIDNGTSDDYYTPPWVFKALKVEFDLDVCGPVGGVPWIPAKRTLSIINDGLNTEWQGRVWMNPPYSNPLPWVRKFVKHNDGVAFLPTSSGKWMLELWQSDCMWLAAPVVRFYTSDFLPAKGMMPLRCWLVAAGDVAIEALKQSNLGKVR